MSEHLCERIVGLGFAHASREGLPTKEAIA
jgi:hypothetical protein